MGSKAVDELPPGAGWQFEPKWDGLPVALAFATATASNYAQNPVKPLGRYFPEIGRTLFVEPSSPASFSTANW